MIRFLDILFSLLGLIILSPILVVIAISILLDSKGGVVFKQNRVGKNSKIFTLYKFRTMYSSSENQGLLTIGFKDARITPVGFYLRKYKLDELPQLWNVLTGTMSLVGPRPEVEKYLPYYTEEQLKVLRVLPGITDPASIYYRNENEILSHSGNPEQTYIQEILPHKLQLSLSYVERPTLQSYFSCIFSTLFPSKKIERTP